MENKSEKRPPGIQSVDKFAFIHVEHHWWRNQWESLEWWGARLADHSAQAQRPPINDIYICILCH
jgi:hypothetical protein